MSPKEVINTFEEKLSGREHISPSELIKTGLFRSTTSIKAALARGDFSALRVSPNRLLISTKSVLAHLYRSIEGNTKAA